MARIFYTQNGDKCDSDYERAIIDDLIDRGVSYEYESKAARFDYATPVTNGSCEACGERGKRVVQRRYRTLDIYLPDSGVIVEVKGRFTATNRTYMRHIVRCNPDADIRMIFMADAWQTKAHKRRYTDFCRANGIPCVVGDPRQKPGTKAYGIGGLPSPMTFLLISTN